MSDLLNSASLVMIPSGYKEDVVYSQIPTDGSGDLSFTRASNGTRVNSAGLVEVCPWNMLSNSEEFTTGNGWFANTTGGSTATQTSNYGVAPNGTTTADRIQLALNSGAYADWVLIPTLPIVVGQVYTYSMYMKSLTGTTTLQFLNDASGGITKTITTEWVRYDYTFTATNVQIYPRFLIQSGTSTSADLLAWGAQLNIGSTAKPYFPTTDRLNVPRLTYQNGGGGCPSLLLEKQSTNLFSYSNAEASMAFNGTLTLNNTTSPEGVSNAFSFLVNANANGGLAIQTITTSAQSYTFSAYLKGSVNGQKVRLFGDLNSTIEDFTLTTDWVRYTKTFTGAVGGQSIYLLNGAYMSPAQNNLYYGYGMQMEVSSYATSLIPSNGSSATRVADACFKTGISSLIGQTSGSVFFDFEISNLSEAGGEKVLWYMKDGGTGERYVTVVNDGRLVYVEYTTSAIAVIEKPSLTIGRHKCAIGYANNDMVLYVDGVQAGTDTSGTPNGFSTFGLQYYSSGASGSQQVNQAVIFKTRLTNAELASLTTI